MTVSEVVLGVIRPLNFLLLLAVGLTAVRTEPCDRTTGQAPARQRTHRSVRTTGTAGVGWHSPTVRHHDGGR